MTTRRLLPILLAVFAAVVPLAAQFGVAPVALIPPSEPVRLETGGTVVASFETRIPDGLHLQSDAPPLDFLVPTSLRLELPPGARTVEIRFPETELLTLAGFDEVLPIFSGAATLVAVVATDPDAEPGVFPATAVLAYQACDDTNCFPPTEVRTEFTVEIVPGSGDGTATAPSPPAEAVDGVDTAAAAEGGWLGRGWGFLSGDGGAGGFLLGLLLVFLGGLALNLTPCVYPVIAVTVGYFSNQAATGGRSRRWGLAGAYALGIVVTFTVLFVIAALTGHAFGTWLQNPWVLLGIAAVIVALALSCFGLYDIQPPAWLMSKVGPSRSGVVGALLMGLTMGVTAAPCVGPIIGVLLVGIGQRGDVLLGTVVGLALSLGLALPYFLLGAFPGWISRMPRAGDWMEWVKRLFGFVLLGVGIYFLAPVLPAGWFLPALAVLSAVAAVWLGIFERVGRKSSAIWFARGAVFVLGLGAAVGLARLGSADTLEFETYSEERLAEAAAAGRPVMIDFTAEWCAPCRVLELQVFPDSAVRAAAEGVDLLKVDLTHEDEIATAAAIRFGVQGPPTLVFIGPDGVERAELRAGESIPARDLVRRLEAVRVGPGR